MQELSKSYEPEKVEKKWYAAWQDGECFRGVVDPSREPYTVMIPPPNVTGVLTMGHVLNNTIQDILVRRARQEGKSVLWLPGTDHAGIATQNKVKQFLSREGISIPQLGREKFLEYACQWRDEHGGLIFKQLQALGASCDWSRSVHTLDPDYSRAVLRSFVKLYERGYIYRGKRMVNWCPVSLTALSDEEVIMKPQNGLLYRVRYEIVENPGEFVEICTTRPETIMADTAIAINPIDERYRHLNGKHVWRPLSRAKIPVILDSAVEIEFGTGVLKVTPAHDPMDFEIGERHKLPIIDIFNPDGTLNDLAGEPFVGLDRFKARKVAAEELQSHGLLVAQEPYQNNVGFSERADVPIESRISEQWFLKYPKVNEAKEVVRQGLIKFWPERWAKTYLQWLDNIHDWCISRQLWWGHRIPVWYRKGEDRSDPKHWHISLEAPIDLENWEQDEDVLDTWASSWLWPFATLGWPDEVASEEQGLSYFYPTSDLVTGPDIIFFWVARMIMAGLEFMGEEKKSLDQQDFKQRIPFNNVYFTGIIRDLEGRKMSKSLGNSPDPLDLIKKYGADGLRFAVMAIAPQGQDVHFSEERVEIGRNFCNKLWNAARFRQMSGETQANTSLESILQRIMPEALDADDRAIMGRLAQTLDVIRAKYAVYEFNAITQEIYNFFWTDFCDWYVEVSKTKLKDDALRSHSLAIQDLVIREVLLMLHPFMPFITEELWHQLGYAKEGQFLQNVKWLDAEELLALFNKKGIASLPEAIEEIGKLREFVSEARALKAQYQLASKKDVSFFVIPHEGMASVVQHEEKLCRLIGASSITLQKEPKDLPARVTPLGTLYLDIVSAIDVDAERARLLKELERLQKQVHAGEAKLQDESFLSKAPEKVVAGAREQLGQTQAKFEEVQRLLKALSS